MGIKVLQMIRVAPAAKRAVEALVAPGASASKTVWYNLGKVVVTVMAAAGVGWTLSEEELDTIASLIALVVPCVAALLDCLANLWLRKRTSEPLAAKAERNQQINPKGR